MADLTEVLQTALALSAADRARLAETLLSSLDDLSEEESEQLWAEEAQRRLHDYRSGHATASDSQTVASKAEKLLR